jgi:hypothetical protein
MEEAVVQIESGVEGTESLAVFDSQIQLADDFLRRNRGVLPDLELSRSGHGSRT